jgi:hypothetical protein
MFIKQKIEQLWQLMLLLAVWEWTNCVIIDYQGGYKQAPICLTSFHMPLEILYPPHANILNFSKNEGGKYVRAEFFLTPW